MQINAGLFSLALAGFVALASSQPHGNLKHRAAHDRHLMGRGANVKTEVVTTYVTVTGYPTATDGGVKPAAVTGGSQSKGGDYQNHDSSSAPAYSAPTTTAAAYGSSSSASKSTSSPAAASSSPASDSYNLDVDPVSGKGVDSNPNTGKDFPDGVYDCDQFPSAYGAVPLTWVTKQGWSGIQLNGGNADAIGECSEGALCSYSCPAGFSKSQWPADQPASGESHGGLLCKGGKLHLTRPSYPQLCQAGESGVFVKNTMSKFVAVCRTDYPGTENMVVPLACGSGTEKALTVPVSDVSYKWQGKPTSAQYYVNPSGVDVKDGCAWGKEGGGIGNWSPMIFGAGEDSGFMWLSISQNQLNGEALGYNVAIIGGNSVCKYENGKFSTSGGCTTAVKPGQKAYFVLYDLGSECPSV